MIDSEKSSTKVRKELGAISEREKVKVSVEDVQEILYPSACFLCVIHVKHVVSDLI